MSGERWGFVGGAWVVVINFVPTVGIYQKRLIMFTKCLRFEIISLERTVHCSGRKTLEKCRRRKLVCVRDVLVRVDDTPPDLLAMRVVRASVAN